MKKRKKLLTILTPTYNRAYILKKAYQSLKNQDNKNFEWIIVDDGSSDNTKQLVENLMQDDFVDIKYIHKKNGGKHTALNKGLESANGELTLILDSDDELTTDAVSIVLESWKKYSKDNSLAGMCFLRKYPNDTNIINKSFSNETISNSIDLKYNKNIKGDMCEVYRTNVLKKYPFPVFGNEKFLSEAIIWNKISLYYNIVYYNIPIYICEYLDDGLSKSCLYSRYKCPVGALENAKLFMNEKFKMIIRIKNSILYSGFSFINKRKISQIIKQSKYKILTLLFIPFGFIFYMCLNIKFRGVTKHEKK